MVVWQIISRLSLIVILTICAWYAIWVSVAKEYEDTVVDSLGFYLQQFRKSTRLQLNMSYRNMSYSGFPRDYHFHMNDPVITVHSTHETYHLKWQEIIFTPMDSEELFYKAEMPLRYVVHYAKGLTVEEDYEIIADASPELYIRGVRVVKENEDDPGKRYFAYVGVKWPEKIHLRVRELVKGKGKKKRAPDASQDTYRHMDVYFDTVKEAKFTAIPSDIVPFVRYAVQRLRSEMHRQKAAAPTTRE